MEETKKQEKTNNAILWIVIILGLIIFAFLIWVFANKNETYTSRDNNSNTHLSFIQCSAKVKTDHLFSSYASSNSNYRLKMIFKNNKIDDISFEYTDTYNSEKEAENALAAMHGSYNIYMRNQSLDPEKYNPVFIQTENQVKVSIYVENKRIVTPLAPIISLAPETIKTIDQYSPQDLKRIYERDGFTCGINE